MRMMRQLSIFGSRRTWVSLRRRLVAKPTASPMIRLPKKTSRKMPMLSNRLSTVNFPAVAPSRYFCAVSNKTIAMASFKMDSPKMTV